MSPYVWCPPVVCIPILKEKQHQYNRRLAFTQYQESPYPGLKEKESVPSILNRFKGISHYNLPVISMAVFMLETLKSSRRI